jgi:hypothetical protein
MRQEAAALRDFSPANAGLGSKSVIAVMSAARPLFPGDLNRSTQHLLILLDKEVADGDVTDIVHGEAEG